MGGRCNNGAVLLRDVGLGIHKDVREALEAGGLREDFLLQGTFCKLRGTKCTQQHQCQGCPPPGRALGGALVS